MSMLHRDIFETFRHCFLNWYSENIDRCSDITYSRGRDLTKHLFGDCIRMKSVCNAFLEDIDGPPIVNEDRSLTEW